MQLPSICLYVYSRASPCNIRDASVHVSTQSASSCTATIHPMASLMQSHLHMHYSSSNVPLDILNQQDLSSFLNLVSKSQFLPNLVLVLSPTTSLCLKQRLHMNKHKIVRVQVYELSHINSKHLSYYGCMQSPIAITYINKLITLQYQFQFKSIFSSRTR